ncbi:MAG: CPBP family intramembrane glutamic endopeptidase [Myxococcota bacterium]|nr:CPBP family intramembrane glutamic endopeptidase [Myxococcota bacterium]
MSSRRGSTESERRAVRSIAICAAAAATGIALYAAGLGGAPSLRALGLGSLGIELFLGALAVAGASFSGGPVAARLGLGPGHLHGARTVALVVGTLALSFALDGLLEITQWRAESPLPDLEARLAGARGADLVLAIAAIGIAPAIGEELLCRGLVQRGLQPLLGPVAAVSIAALLFGALHGNPVHGLAAGLLGLYLGAVAVIADSTRPAILCHGANNVVAVGVAALWPGLAGPGWVGVVAGLAVAGFCLRFGWPPTPRGGLQVEPGSDDP